MNKDIENLRTYNEAKKTLFVDKKPTNINLSFYLFTNIRCLYK